LIPQQAPEAPVILNEVKDPEGLAGVRRVSVHPAPHRALVKNLA
jgi:hypothetical protein